MNLPDNVNITVESDTARQVMTQRISNDFTIEMVLVGILLMVVIFIIWGIRTLHHNSEKDKHCNCSNCRARRGY